MNLESSVIAKLEADIADDLPCMRTLLAHQDRFETGALQQWVAVGFLWNRFSV